MKLGRYEIQGELGRGAMGRVFLAYDPQIDRKVAIKIVQSFSALRGSELQEARDRFLREARSAGKLLHPGIVTLFDVGEVEGTLYLAMEFVEGETLDTFCRPDRLLPVSQVVEIVAGAAEALDYAHRAGIVHRDIKPGNLMRTGETTAKIMDFGLARGAETNVTHDGALLGTPSYMAPEQIRGRGLDGRSDLFSLGVVLYELLTGEKPFAGDSVSSVIYRIVNEHPRDPSRLSPRVTPELARVLRRALDKRVDQRFQTGSEFAAALRKIAPSLQMQLPAIETATEGAAAAGGARRSPARSASGRPASSTPARGTIPAAGSRRVKRSSPVPFVLAIFGALVAAAGAAYYYREPLGIDRYLEREPVVFETRVLVEPPDASVTVGGEPLDPLGDGIVRFAEDAPPAEIVAEYACRREERVLGPEVAGVPIEIVLEPVELDYLLELDETPARVAVNGEAVGETPVELQLELCRENHVELSAPRYRDAAVDIPEGATADEARSLLASLSLEPVPVGQLVFPDTPVKLTYFVDGERVDPSSGPLELLEGTHRVRVTNDRYWIDVTDHIEIEAGSRVEAAVPLPGLTDLVVFAYPPNAKVELRRPGGRWEYIDDVPVRRRIAAGRYEIRVTLRTNGESKTREVVLGAGTNPEVRVSFGGAT